MEFIAELLAFFAGAISGSLLTLHFKKQKASGNSTIVDQSGASAKGDIIGRDKFGK